MDKRVILAKAGAGKTYYICHDIDPYKRNLILAFTNQNIKNLIREVKDKNGGKIPDKTTIMTFHSFVYSYLIRPFENIISNEYKVERFRSEGLEVQYSPEPQTINNKPNYKYKKDSFIEHYYTASRRLYVERMSKILLKPNKKALKKGINYINMFFDKIYIDEFQDFRLYDWELIEYIIKKTKNILLVGDFYQHSTSGSNNSGKPFKKYNTYIKYKEYLEEIGLEVDENTLLKTRRCPEEISDYVSKKLNVEFESHEDNNNIGSVTIVEDLNELTKILNNNKIKKLVWSNATKKEYNAINWGYSKGDTYESVCVILTEKASNEIFKDKPSFTDGSTNNKLYVALTRTKGNLYIVRKDLYDKI